MVLSPAAGQQQWATAPASHVITGKWETMDILVAILHPYDCFVISVFQKITQDIQHFSTNTLLDYFAQL